MALYTTEIASAKLVSDNPIHQRLYYAYVAAQSYIKGDLLEIGCGEGRGVELLAPLATSYTALDKNNPIIEELSKKFSNIKFIQAVVPPIKDVADNTYDIVVSFQVIEHIAKDRLFLEEIHRVLKPGGKVLITTPNKRKTLSRNPWHEREYVNHELLALAKSVFPKVELKGVQGNDKVMAYYEDNKKSVRKFTRFDIFNLQYRLPNALLRLPYDILNRMNRQSLMNSNNKLVSDIHFNDYFITDDTENCLDFFGVFEK